MRAKKTVLIIKVGYCETLANEQGFVPSLGDVFRHTVLLHHYSDYRVTWLTSESVYPLLQGNPYIHELLIYNARKTQTQLHKRKFDEVLCLEKAPFLCNLAKNVAAGQHLGFGRTGRNLHAHPMSEEALKIANGHKSASCIQALLYNMVGAEWRGEDYISGYHSDVEPTFDIGLNYLVGSKWPTKAWPMSYWRKLERLCRAAGWSLTWQQGSRDLYAYMDWINSVKLIVTCDSLGMHLGLAYRKKVVALFGSTPSSQIHMYNRGVILHAPTACEHPCMQPVCARNAPCMNTIQPADVVKAICGLIGMPAKTTMDIRAGKLQIAPEPAL